MLFVYGGYKRYKLEKPRFWRKTGFSLENAINP